MNVTVPFLLCRRLTRKKVAETTTMMNIMKPLEKLTMKMVKVFVESCIPCPTKNKITIIKNLIPNI